MFKLDAGNCLLLKEEGILLVPMMLLLCKFVWFEYVWLKELDEESELAACEVKFLSTASSGFCTIKELQD